MTDMHKVLLKAIEPKSDQLNADDFITGPRNLKIKAVKPGDSVKQVYIYLEGFEERPYKPCKGMLRVLTDSWPGCPTTWVGRWMRLFRNPEVMYAGEKVGGIQISKLSGIEKGKEFILTISKTKRVKIFIDVLHRHEYVQGQFSNISERVSKAVSAFDSCENQDELSRLTERVDGLFEVCDDEQRALIRDAVNRNTLRITGKE